MSNTIQAIFEGGLFRPTVKVNLVEGTSVDVVLPSTAQPRDPKIVAAKLAAISASTVKTGQPDNSSETHDEIIYGRKAEK